MSSGNTDSTPIHHDIDAAVPFAGQTLRKLKRVSLEEACEMGLIQAVFAPHRGLKVKYDVQPDNDTLVVVIHPQ